MEDDGCNHNQCSRATDTRFDCDSVSAGVGVSVGASASACANVCDASGCASDRIPLKRSSSLKLQRFIKLPLWNSASSSSPSSILTSSAIVVKPGKSIIFDFCRSRSPGGTRVSLLPCTYT